MLSSHLPFLPQADYLGCKEKTSPPLLDAQYVVEFMLLDKQPVLGNKVGQMGGCSSEIYCGFMAAYATVHTAQLSKLLIDYYEAK